MKNDPIIDSLDHIGINDIINLYDKKNKLTKEGNFEELLALKKEHPAIFSEENEKQISDLQHDIHCIINSSWFKESQKKEMKKKLIIVNPEEWEIGMLNKFLKKQDKIAYSQIADASRELVKEAITICNDVFQTHPKNVFGISNAFPLAGLLISELILHFPKNEQEKMLSRAIYKIAENETLYYDEEIFDKWKNSIVNHNAIEKSVKEKFSILLNSLIVKFDNRKGFYSDLFFFCLLEVSEFIGLLSANIGRAHNETKNDVINKVKGNIFTAMDNLGITKEKIFVENN